MARWSRQPTAPVGVDWSNPLTRGLMCLWNPVGRGYDAVTGYIGGSGASGTSIYPYRGTTIQASIAASTAYNYQASLAASSIGAAQDFTALQIVPQPVAHYWGYTNNQSSSTATGFQFFSPGGTNWQFAIGDGTTQYATPTILPPGAVAGEGVAVWGQRIGNTVYTLSGNVSASIAASNVALPATSILNTGNNANNGGVPSISGPFALWGRALTLSERLLLESNPWQLFAPIRKQTSYFLSGSSSYSYTMSGGILIAGDAAESKIKVVTSSSGLAFSGSSQKNIGHEVSPAGGLIFGGSPSPSDVRPVSPSGGVTFGGSATVSYNGVHAFTYTGTGGMTFGGTASENKTKDISGSGGFQTGGSAGYSFIPVNGPKNILSAIHRFLNPIKRNI